jgi:hypothetical protein
MTNDPKLDGAGFLRRWSERKHAAKSGPVALPAPEAAEQTIEPFDPESLPTIESLTADSDYAAFLRPGVPAELTRAALRQAWTSDPVISTFKEMADYDWDFNAPGYGALLPTDDVQALLSRVINRPEPEPEPEPGAPPQPEAPQEVAAGSIEDAAPTKNFVAPPAPPTPEPFLSEGEFAAAQQGLEGEDSHTISAKQTLRRPRHGGALPL